MAPARRDGVGQGRGGSRGRDDDAGRGGRDGGPRPVGQDGDSRDGARPRGGPGRRGDAGPPAGATRLFVSAGRRAGMRPQDLVGAITGESRLSGRDIGAIDVADGFSLVDVPERAADDVVRALRSAKIRGRDVTVRRDRDGRPSAVDGGRGGSGAARRKPRARAGGGG